MHLLSAPIFHIPNSLFIRYLEAYLETGKERMLNASRIVFGKHKDGCLFPMCMSLKVRSRSCSRPCEVAQYVNAMYDDFASR